MPSIRVLTVGASLSLSGRFAVQGRQAYQGLTLWADDVNRAGGLTVHPGEPPLPVRLIIYDDASRRANAAANTERLISEDGVHLLLGPYSSVLTLAAAEAAAPHDRTIWNHGGSSDAMDARGWQHVVTLLSSASRYFEPLLEMAAQQDGRPIRTVALLRGAQGTFPAAVIGGARDHARRLGLGIVFDGMYPEVRHTAPSPQPPYEGEGVHSVLVRQLADLAPDLILGAGTTEADIAFALEIRRQGVNSALIGLVAAGVQAFREALGADAAGICGPSQWEPTAAAQPDIGPSSAAFARSYRARFRAEPDYPAA
ncbi:MAG: ABC transporter substrate-binding protein, partial [Chloroflexota bacterium]